MTPVDKPASAPGKAFLIGEYAVLDGATALVTAVDVRAVAHRPRPEHGEAPGSDSNFVVEARKVVIEHLRELGRSVAEIPDVPIVTTLGFTAGERKLGLGSSAAVAASVVGYHLQAAGFDLADEQVRQTAFALAKKAHTTAQDGRGSGADVAAAVLGGTLRFSIDGVAQPIAGPPWLAVGFFDAGAPAATGSFVRAVKTGAEAQPEPYARAIQMIEDASRRFVGAFDPKVDVDVGMSAIAEAAALHNEGLRGLQALAQASIMTPAIETIVAAANRHGLAAKPSGAGGGDLVVVFARDRTELDYLSAQLLRDHGFAQVGGLVVGADGLRAEARPPVNSRLEGFFKLDVATRRLMVAKASGLDQARFEDADSEALPLETAAHMIENVIGTLTMPLAVATNFRVNGRDYLVPMCVEEASVVAAASNAAKMARAGGGFAAHSDPPWMITQIQLVRDDHEGAAEKVLEQIGRIKGELMHLADAAHPRLVARGGGSRDIETRVLDADNVVVHVLVDCQDAMGANLLNTVAESVAPRLEGVTGWRSCLRILSNLADRRASHVTARIPPEALTAREWPGELVVDRIVEASRFAELDPYRATTHNKGIMNGVDSVVLATGNDWRAMEAAAHAYVAREGRYGPLAVWRRGHDGWLEGRISLPTAVGVVGGATRSHPTARLALEILGSPTATELGHVIAAVGLASNLAALRALATEGIQRGHMTLHARAVALSAGAEGKEVELLANRLIDVGEIKPERAQGLLLEIRAGR